MDGDGVGLWGNPVKARVGYGTAAKLIVPAFLAKLRAKDGGRPVVAAFKKFQQYALPRKSSRISSKAFWYVHLYSHRQKSCIYSPVN